LLQTCGLLLLWAVCLSGQETPLARATHVVVIGYDGLSPRGMREGSTPTFDGLLQTGASTMTARAVMPTSSSSNWGSMIMGVGPEQHGITSNDWQPDKFTIAPVTPGPAGFSETMFSVLRRARPTAHIAVFHDWKDFGRLVEPGVPNHISHELGPRNTMRKAAEYFRQHRPHLLFVHLDHVDAAGHRAGWHTPVYREAVELADQLTADLLKAVDEAGVLPQTAFLLTSDHGGIGTSHGGETMDELLIPWLVSGPGIARGRQLQRPVNTYDTACTALMLLGVAPPETWICHPVREALAP
jgi:predicted AlkP superfamily pyrophosphatase or phosphodiesterase